MCEKLRIPSGRHSLRPPPRPPWTGPGLGSAPSAHCHFMTPTGARPEGPAQTAQPRAWQGAGHRAQGVASSPTALAGPGGPQGGAARGLRGGRHAALAEGILTEAKRPPPTAPRPLCACHSRPEGLSMAPGWAWPLAWPHPAEQTEESRAMAAPHRALSHGPRSGVGLESPPGPATYRRWKSTKEQPDTGGARQLGPTREARRSPLIVTPAAPFPSKNAKLSRAGRADGQTQPEQGQGRQRG